jgi:hypothetical protein
MHDTVQRLKLEGEGGSEVVNNRSMSATRVNGIEPIGQLEWSLDRDLSNLTSPSSLAS